MDEILLYLVAKYKGNGMKVYQALEKKEKITIEKLKKVIDKLPNETYITLIDDRYPEFMKGYYKPAFILIKEGKKGYVPYGKNLSKRFEVKAKAEEEYKKNLDKYCA